MGKNPSVNITIKSELVDILKNEEAVKLVDQKIEMKAPESFMPGHLIAEYLVKEKQ